MQEETKKTVKKKYQRFMPVCSHCGRVRTAANNWKKVSKLVVTSPFTELTHSLCPECTKIHYPDLF
ncbi:MAG TPA: hypothetical protein ENN69_00475 [Spirochaetia bacterium]|nr:hypothetical protein [Spirochaetia bacterium]